MYVLYLHGFASSPQSHKSVFLKQKFYEWGITLHVPNLNVPSFPQLTISDQITHLGNELDGILEENIYIIASSLGALVAIHYMEKIKDPRVRKLVLFAPAFDFIKSRYKVLGERLMKKWETEGHILLYHYGMQSNLPVHYNLIEDTKRYDSYRVNVNIPTLIIHGTADDEVDYGQSVEFAKNRSNILLKLIEANHSLKKPRRLYLVSGC